MLYFDNASTTPLFDEVKVEMLRVMNNYEGNPSSIHKYGREAKVLIEESRKIIADSLLVNSSSIYFTSGGTEAINIGIRGCVDMNNITDIITSPIEHHAVMNCIEHLVVKNGIKSHNVKILSNGDVCLNSLNDLLQKITGNVLVVLMHANNEIGNLLPIEKVVLLCKSYKALFFCDMTQSIGKYKIDLTEKDIDFAVSSAHKYGGPKGIGFLYLKPGIKITSMMLGGGQENNLRGGTENIYAIAGMSKAFELINDNIQKQKSYIEDLKYYFIEKIKESIDGIEFNGTSECDGLYNLVNISFPVTAKSEMFIYNLDIANVAISAGSACASGSFVGSHVLNALKRNSKMSSVRFSFGRQNSKEEIDTLIELIKKFY